MAKMKIQISKDDFEQSILVATSSHSEVFESVEPHFKESYQRISKQILGEVGEKALETSEEALETSENPGTTTARSCVKQSSRLYASMPSSA